MKPAKPAGWQPLIEEKIFRPIGEPVLVESAELGRKVLRQHGVIQSYTQRNQNGRLYPKKLWEALFKPDSDFMERLQSRAMVGLLEHPEDGITRLDRSPSHLMTEVHFASPKEITESRKSDPKHPLEEGDIIGTLEVIEGTRNGDELKALIEAKVQIGVSSRGGGTLKEDGEGHTVNEDYECETWDVVQSPSVSRAIPRKTEVTHESAPVPPVPPVVEAVPPTPAPVVESKVPVAPVVKLFCENGAVRYEIVEDATGSHVYDRKDEKNLHDCATPELAHQWVMENLKASAPAQALPLAPVVKPSTPAPSVPLQESTNTTIMSHRDKLRTLDLDVTRLTSTPVKGLKPSAKSSMFESITSLRVEIAGVLKEDSTLQPIADKQLKRLTEYEDELDAEPIPEGPVSHEGDGDFEDFDHADEGGGDDDVMCRAAAKLRTLGDEGDEEAAGLADELDAVCGDGDEPPMDDVPPPAPEGDAPPMESKLRSFIKRMKGKYVKLESAHRRLTAATATLLERYRTVKKHLTENGGGRPADQQSIEEYENAARDIADRYNRHMIEMGKLLMQAKQPGLYEANEDRFKRVRTWKQFGEVSQQVVAKRPLREGVQPPVKKPASSSSTNPPPDPPLTETVHPSVMMATRARHRSTITG
jgi:hypothetical protein